MSQKSTVYVFALLVGLCAAAISYYMPFFPYFDDSTHYIEQARSFMSRGVFEVTPYGINDEEANVTSIPDNLFPLGYPLLIALSSTLTRLPAEIVAPWLSLTALFFLPTIIVFTFHRVLGGWPALWIGALVALTPAAIRHGYLAYSDTLSLVLVIYAVHLLLTAGHRTSYWFWLGILTGFSYLLRNANLSLLLSICIYLFWDFMAESENRKEKISNGLVWMMANILVIAPWLIRNFYVFGQMQPYKMGPSELTLEENIHAYLKAQLDTLLALGDLDVFLARNPWGIAFLLLLLAVLLQQTLKTWKHWQKFEQKTFILAFIYSVIGAIIVIATRTKYQWGGLIEARYALPYSCFVLVALAIIYKHCTVSIDSKLLGIGLAIALLFARFWELPKLYQYDQYENAILAAANQIKTNQDSICNNLNGRFGISNFAFAYRILCAAPVRNFHYEPEQKFIDESLQGWAELGGKYGIIVSVFPWKDHEQTDMPLQRDRVMKLNSLGWQVERNEKENLIISHKANSAR